MFRIFISLILCFVFAKALDEIDINGLDLPQDESNKIEIPATQQDQMIENITDLADSIKANEEKGQEELDKKENIEQKTQEEQVDIQKSKQEDEKIEVPLLPQNFDGKEEVIDSTKDEARQREEKELKDKRAKLEEQKKLEEELMQEDQDLHDSFVQEGQEKAEGQKSDIQLQNQEQKEVEKKQEIKDKPHIQLEETTSKKEEKQEGKEVSFAQEDFFELDEDDFALEKQDGSYVIRVLSPDLEAFMSGRTYNEKNQIQTFGVNDNFTQIVSQDGKIQEYKFFQKTSRKNTILSNVKFPLEKIDFDTYKIVMKDIPSSFDISNCKVAIRKELSAVLNQNKEVIIDLDIKRELRNTTNFKLFLNCPR